MSKPSPLPSRTWTRPHSGLIVPSPSTSRLSEVPQVTHTRPSSNHEEHEHGYGHRNIALALRTYSLALSLSLGPALVPFVLKFLQVITTNTDGSFGAGTRKRLSQALNNVDLAKLKRVLNRELGYEGFAFCMTLAVAGGSVLKDLWKCWRWKDFRAVGLGVPVHNESVDEVGGVDAADKSQTSRSSIWRWFSNISPETETFLAHALSASLAFALLQSGANRTSRSRAALGRRNGKSTNGYGIQRATSPTLDLTLLLLVRAVDCLVQGGIIWKTIGRSTVTSSSKASSEEKSTLEKELEKAKQDKEAKEAKEIRYRWTSHIDAFVFWACSARIMWCFFYEPYQLPRSYVKWIKRLANLDGRVITTLQDIRSGEWSYIRGASPSTTSKFASGRLPLQEAALALGYPATWGDPSILPAYGGPQADEVWTKLGVKGRKGMGGVPCEVLHLRTPFGLGSSLGLERSCTVNALLRMMKGFIDAMMIYLPVHLLPILLTRPLSLLRPSTSLSTRTLLPPLRSSLFLSSFISLYWFFVCLTRTLVLPMVFRRVGHDIWDGPYGCIMAGCLACGGSIWLEDGRRRGEMAIYVLPRAVRTVLDAFGSLSGKGIGKRRGRWLGRQIEKVTFIISFAVLLTAARHRPDTLRGLSKWTLKFVLDGPTKGFWRRMKRRAEAKDPSGIITPEVRDRDT